MQANQGLLGYLMDVAGPCLVHATVTSLPSPGGGLPAGGPSMVVPGSIMPGTYLHFRFEGSPPALKLRTPQGDPTAADYVSQSIIVDFESPSCFPLPCCGQLVLLAGLGEYSFDGWQMSPVDPSSYTPDYHWLRTVVTINMGVFTVPPRHNYLLGYDSTVKWTTVSGDVLTPSFNIPGTVVNPGDVLIPSKYPATAVTGWKG